MKELNGISSSLVLRNTTHRIALLYVTNVLIVCKQYEFEMMKKL